MQPASATDTAWSLIGEALGREPDHPGPIWIPQPEPGEALVALVHRLGPARCTIYQTLRPHVDALRARGLASVASLPAESAEPPGLVLFVPTRQRIESLALAAHGLTRLGHDGALVLACGNDQGAGGYLGRLGEVAPSLVAESGRKHRVAVIRAGQIEDRAPFEAWLRAAEPTTVPGTSLVTMPGIYGWQKIDRGSALLVSTLPELHGRGADLGAGYGYLAAEVLRRSPRVAHVEVVEAESRALDCARENLRAFGDRVAFHWIDVGDAASGAIAGGLDWVVVNPPFHEGRASSPDLGRAFIDRAAALLAPGGRLYLVANVFLGYERALAARFASVERVIERDGFKVLHARR